MSEIETYLSSKGLTFKRAGSDNIHLPCFFHGEDPADRGRLYISTEAPYIFQCFVCGERGAYNKVRRHFGDSTLHTVVESKTEEDLPDDTQLAILEEATNFYHDSLLRPENEDTFKYLRYQRGLTVETITNFRLGWSDGGLLTHLVGAGFDIEDVKKTGLVDRFGEDVLKEMIIIPYLHQGNPVQLRGKDPAAKYLTVFGDKHRLFNRDALQESDTVVICEGEIDAMTLAQLGYAAVGLPGASGFQGAWTDLFEHCRRIYICLDNDKAGRLGAEKTAVKLGQRARVVEMPEDADVNEWVARDGRGRDDFDALFARSVGGLLVTVDQAFERWEEYEGNPNLVGIRWNIAQIDEQMRHGLLPGQVVTLLAKTNAGKTLMSLNMFQRMAAVREDLKIMFVSLEQTRNEWYERARRIYSFYDPWAEHRDVLNFWRPRLVLTDKNRMTEDELLGAIEQYEYEMGCRPHFMCIDYLGYFARSYRGDAYERTTAAIMALKHIAKEKSIIIYCPHQVNRQGSFGKELSADMAKESGAVEETSDMILTIWNPDQQTGKSMHDQQGEVHMKILKSRDGPIGQQVMFQFCPRTLALIPTSDPLIHQAQKERTFATAGDTWETVLYRMRSGDDHGLVKHEEALLWLAENPVAV